MLKKNFVCSFLYLCYYHLVAHRQNMDKVMLMIQSLFQAKMITSVVILFIEYLI